MSSQNCTISREDTAAEADVGTARMGLHQIRRLIGCKYSANITMVLYIYSTFEIQIKLEVKS